MPGEITPSQLPLLHSKLMPPHLNASLVVREALFAQLDKGLQKKLILVTAPTGAGKTTLVGLWLNKRHIPFAWVNLDENDNDPVRFWTYIATALRTFGPTVGRRALASLMSAQAPSIEPVLVSLINDLEKTSQSCVLVLEDYHAIREQKIIESVQFLLQYLPVNTHLVLISRSEPDLSLGIMRARDELLEIDSMGLRFSLDETSNFFKNVSQVTISTPTLVELNSRIDGWAAGLRLAAMSILSQDPNQDVEAVFRSFSGSHPFVADYLIREVIEKQPQGVRNFLIETCFLSQLTGSLCNAITEQNDGEAILEQLEKANLFLVRLEYTVGPVWYRYNPLFAEAIQLEARHHLGKQGMKTLYEKACAWFVAQQLYDDAIEMALQAESFDMALVLIEKYIEIHDFSSLFTLNRWLALVPKNLILAHPEICLVYSQVILYTSDRFSPATASRIEPFLQAAGDTWRAAGKIDKVGAVSALRGMIFLWKDEPEKAFEYVHRSLEELPDHDIYWRSISMLNYTDEALRSGQMVVVQDRVLEARALMGAAQNIHGILAASQYLSQVFYWQGDHEQVIQLNQEILEKAVGGAEMLDDQGVARLSLARVDYERNEIDRAAQNAHLALELATKRRSANHKVQSTILLASIDAAHGSFNAGQERLRMIEAGLETGPAVREIQSAQALLSIRAGDMEMLGWWQSLIEQNGANVSTIQREREALTMARLQIGQGNYGSVHDLLYPWIEDSARNGRIRSQIEAWCIEALALLAKGEADRARQVFSHALAAGQGKGFKRLFIDFDRPMAALLQNLLPSLTNRSLRYYATSLLQSFPAEQITQSETGSDSFVMVEPLSQQETRILRLIAAGMSNSDIGRELVVSDNTIKTHVKNIYRKLNVNSRQDAQIIARELNLY